MMAEDPDCDPVAAYQDVCASNLGHLMDKEDVDKVFFHTENVADV